MDQTPQEKMQRTGKEAWPELRGAPSEWQSRGKGVCRKACGQENAENCKTGGMKERTVTEQTRDSPDLKEIDDLKKVYTLTLEKKKICIIAFSTSSLSFFFFLKGVVAWWWLGMVLVPSILCVRC